MGQTETGLHIDYPPTSPPVRGRIPGSWAARARWGSAVLLAGSVLLGAHLANAGQLVLTWIDNSAGTATFKIERRSGTTAYDQIATTAAGVTSFVDTTVVAGITYCYRVRAFASGLNSPFSNESCGSSPATGLVLTVVKAGTGTGTVLSTPAGINCGTDCNQSYSTGQVVTLTATPGSGSIFNGWSGSCADTGPCTLTGNTSVGVTATFSVATTPTTGVTLSASPATVAAGSAVTATWSGIPTPTSTDWVGLYTPGAVTPSSPLKWIYVSCTTTPNGARAAGSCPLGVPTGLAPGSYQLRLFANNVHTLLATSSTFSVP